MKAPVVKLDQVNDFLFHKQHLAAPSQDANLVRTVEATGGLHATGAAVPYLSLWARRKDFDKRHLQKALYDERSLGKVLCMRNTLFILPKELLPIAYQATQKQRDALVSRWLRHHGIPLERYQRFAAEIRDLLGSTAKTATEIKQEFGNRSLTALLDVMPFDWQLIRGRPRGTWRSNLHEYGAFEAWFPDVDLESYSAEEALVRLVQHYLCALGPASEEDIVWWAGLGKLEIRQALAAMKEQLSEIQIEGLGPGYLLLTKDLKALERRYHKQRAIKLLPSLDPYIMGYKDRRRVLPPERYNQVFDRAGNALPTVWLDGRVIGVWLENKERSALEVLLFQEADKRLLAELEIEAPRLAHFLEHDPVNVQINLYPEGVCPKTPFTLARQQ
jgi:hypothetical protein